ncbi:hypothetical protein GCM10008927_04820 [Amylibacter ulvae]|uniref:Pilus assembly protein n=1 Tax=Paramylibacter ulvae TaxID=1651968 RepID=A0ABQ3CVI1_9RHOB|nr:hypothetical protein [Amylibacter ulvae]GHA43228.1 hypothetical protein GCM10008927_04820 [Amylibacter ulvae]
MNIEQKETTTSLRTRISAFINNESGAVTVDWVVVAAFLVLLGLGITVQISAAIDSNMGSLAEILTAQTEEMDRLSATNSEDDGS